MGKHAGHWPRLGDGSVPAEDMDEGLGHIVSIPVYNRVYLTLVGLTVLTVTTAAVDFGPLSLIVALGIATFKAGIVTLFFMHLNYENKIFWGIVIYPLFIFLLILLGTLGDEQVKEYPGPMFAKPHVHYEFKDAHHGGDDLSSGEPGSEHGDSGHH